MRKRLFASLTLWAALVAHAAKAASVAIYPTSKDESLVIISGKIEEGDAAKFLRAIRNGREAYRPVKTVVVHSPGGLLREGVRLAETVRRTGVTVSVPLQCASACFLVFAGAAKKEATAAARIGVHGASDTAGNSVGDATVLMAQYSRQLGVPYSIIGKMVVTPPSKMLWLDRDDLVAMGTVIHRAEAGASNAGTANILPPNADRSVKSLLSRRAEQDAQCERQSGPAYDPSACYARAASDRQLHALGWCLRRQSGPDGWHRCDDSSIGP